MAFAIISPANKATRHKIKATPNAIFVKKQTCSCATATGLLGSHSGNYVTLQWTAVAGAVNHSVGGYFQCGATFSQCAPASYGTVTFSFYGPVKIVPTVARFG